MTAKSRGDLPEAQDPQSTRLPSFLQLPRSHISASPLDAHGLRSRASRRRARALAGEAAKRSQELSAEAAKHSSALVSETAKKSKEIFFETASKSREIAAEATKQADLLTGQIKHLASDLPVRAFDPAHPRDPAYHLRRLVGARRDRASDGRVEEVGLEGRGGEGGRLLLALVPRRGGHEHPDALARKAGAQGVAADADVLGAEAVDVGAERLHGARQPRGAPEAVPGQQAELVLDVAADGGRAEQRAPERDHGAGRAAQARPGGVGTRASDAVVVLVVALEDGAEHGAVAVVHQLVRQAELERLPPLLRHRRRVPAPLPLQLQQVHRLDQK